jgi:hypothetical protein
VENKPEPQFGPSALLFAGIAVFSVMIRLIGGPG